MSWFNVPTLQALRILMEGVLADVLVGGGLKSNVTIYSGGIVTFNSARHVTEGVLSQCPEFLAGHGRRHHSRLQPTSPARHSVLIVEGSLRAP